MADQPELNLNLNRTRLKVLHSMTGMLLLSTSSIATADIIAYDLSNTSAERSFNVLEYNNPYKDSFSSRDDGFQKYTFDRNNLNELPSGLIDLTADGRLDNQGLLFEQDFQAFGVVDSVNNSNPDALSMAQWKFDTEGVSNLSVSAKFAAMGDFESSDRFYMVASFHPDHMETLFDISAQTALVQNYTMADGSQRTLNDPLGIKASDSDFTFNLTNVFSEYTSGIVGQGSELTLSLYAKADGGTETFALSDLIIQGEVGQTSPITSPPGFGQPPVTDPNAGGIVGVSEPTGLLLFAAPLFGMMLRRRT